MDSGNFLSSLLTAFPVEDISKLKIDLKKAVIKENYGDKDCKWVVGIKDNLKWNEVTTEILTKKSYLFIHFLDTAGIVYYTPSLMYLTMQNWSLAEESNFGNTVAFFF